MTATALFRIIGSITLAEGLAGEYILYPAVDPNYQPAIHGISVGLMTFGIFMFIAAQLLKQHAKTDSRR